MKSILIALATLVSAGQVAPAQSLNVMTWNIRYNNPADGANAWKHRKDWVAEIVTKQKADIAGFQEVLAGQFADLKERLTEMDSYGVGRDDGKNAGEQVPIFYRKARFDLLDKGTFWLSPTPEKPGSKGWDAAITRIAGWVKLKDRETLTTFYVLNAHFDHRGTEARRQSAEQIVNRVKEQFSEHPVIFVGDLNTKPGTAPYDTLVSKGAKRPPVLRDAYEHSAKKPEGPDSTWNGFDKIVQGNRIDYVFTTETVRVLRLQTLDDQRDGRFPSDHLPVVVELEIKSKK